MLNKDRHHWRTALFYDLLKIVKVMTSSVLSGERPESLRKKILRHFFPGERWNFPENLRIFGAKDLFFFLITSALCPWSLALEHSCPWPREGQSSEGLSLASDFLCPWPLALCPQLHFCVLDSTYVRNIPGIISHFISKT